MSESCRREIVLWRSKHISNLVSLLKLFSPVLSASKASDEEWLSFSEKTSPAAFLRAVRVSGKEAKDSKGRKKERKGKKERKKPSAEGSGLPRKERKRTQAQTHGQYGYKKAPKRFRFRASVKTATTYSPTCAVPSA